MNMIRVGTTYHERDFEVDFKMTHAGGRGSRLDPPEEPEYEPVAAWCDGEPVALDAVPDEVYTVLNELEWPEEPTNACEAGSCGHARC